MEDRLPLVAIEAPDETIGEVFESFQIVGIFDKVFAMFSTMAVAHMRFSIRSRMSLEVSGGDDVKM